MPLVKTRSDAFAPTQDRILMQVFGFAFLGLMTNCSPSCA
jgi:hypothetical protein